MALDALPGHAALPGSIVRTICYIYAFTARNPITSNHFKDFTAAPSRQISGRLTSINKQTSLQLELCPGFHLSQLNNRPTNINIHHARRSVTICSQILWKSRSTPMVMSGVPDTLAHHVQKHSFNRLLSNGQHELHLVRDSCYQSLDFVPSRTPMDYDT